MTPEDKAFWDDWVQQSKEDTARMERQEKAHVARFRQFLADKRSITVVFP